MTDNSKLVADARGAVVAEYLPATTRNKAEFGYYKSIMNRLADALEAVDKTMAATTKHYGGLIDIAEAERNALTVQLAAAQAVIAEAALTCTCEVAERAFRSAADWARACSGESADVAAAFIEDVAAAFIEEQAAIRAQTTNGGTDENQN